MAVAESSLPTFLVVGAMKSGTTTLHRLLGSHPDVFTTRQKELEFFSEEPNWRRGVAWYRSHFADGQDSSARGESSTGYTKFPRYPDVPDRVADVLPWARVVYIVRDPVERMISHYTHNVIDGYEQRPLDEALLHGDNYLDVSRYATQIGRFADRLGADRVHVVFTEDLQQRPDETLQAVFGFLGVEPCAPLGVTATGARENATEGRRQIRPVVGRLSHSWAWRRIRDRVPGPVRTVAQRVTRRRVDVGAVRQRPSAATLAGITDELRPEVARLAEIAGPVPESWSIRER